MIFTSRMLLGPYLRASPKAIMCYYIANDGALENTLLSLYCV